MSRDIISTPLMRANLELLERVDSLSVRTHHRRPAAVEGEVDISVDESEKRRAQILEMRLQKPYPMRLKEIANKLNISKTAIQKHIAALKADGKLPVERKMGRQ